VRSWGRCSVAERVVAIVQARMGSTRLPAKVLQDVGGEPMLVRVMERAHRASLVDEVAVATTRHRRDDVIAELSARRGWPCTRGSEDDVLDRYHDAASTHRADVVVRITSDCPLLDPAVVDVILGERSRGEGADYASNTIEPRTFPRGLDAEAFTVEALDAAWRGDHEAATREHVTPFLYRHPERFTLRGVTTDPDRSWMRWTVDTPEDLEVVRLLHSEVGPDAGWHEMAEAMEAHPEWIAINRHVEQRDVRHPDPR
jgi:spore coat polysaccharide biosynthesis protein SpsF